MVSLGIDPDSWPDLWEAAIRAAERLGGHGGPLEIAPPATAAEVAAMERRMKLRLPESFREVLLRYTARTDFSWYLPDGVRVPVPWGREIFSGRCSWDLEDLPYAREKLQGWVNESWEPNEWEVPFWQDKLGFQFVTNGDIVAIDLADGADGRVVMLSHEGAADAHGMTLGRNFVDYIEKLWRLGCPGNEGSQMRPFLGPDGLEPEGRNGLIWRKWFFGGG